MQNQLAENQRSRGVQSQMAGNQRSRVVQSQTAGNRRPRELPGNRRDPPEGGQEHRGSREEQERYRSLGHMSSSQHP